MDSFNNWLLGLLQGIFGSVVYDLVLAGAVAGLLAILKAKRPTWAPPALYGVMGLTCVFVSIYAFTGRALLFKEHPETTIDNIESNVRTWADGFQLGVRKLDDPTSYFTYSVEMVSQNKCYVARRKAKDHYVLIQCNIDIDPRVYEPMKKLRPEQIHDIYHAVNFELARLRLGYEVIPDANLTWDTPIKFMKISKLIPISTALTEIVFVEAMQEMDNEITVAKEALRMKLLTYPQLPPLFK
jgi:hypothetical protein